MTRVKKESKLVEHARYELKLLGEEEATINGYIKIIKAFSDMRHSGASAMIAIPVINNLLMFNNITPLTNNPDEWTLIDPGMSGLNIPFYQSKRRPDAFSTDGGKTYYLLSEGASAHNQNPSHKSQEWRNDG